MKKYIISILLSGLAITTAAAAQGVRRAVWAGQFYEANRERLAAELGAYFQNAGAPPALRGDLQALIVPHAGYIYSGKTAATAYNLLRGKTFETVVIIGPSHRYGFNGCSIWPEGGFETPLGTASVDSALAAAIGKESGFGFVPEAHEEEHSIEVQVPFVQTILPKAKIVPIVMGFQTRSTIEALASALAKTIPGKNAIVVASTDMSHFLRRDEARKLDLETAESIRDFKLDSLIRKVTAGENIMCGGGGVAAVMTYVKKRGTPQVEILRLSDSSEAGGLDDGVVGYLAAALTTGKDAPRQAVGNRTSLRQTEAAFPETGPNDSSLAGKDDGKSDEETGGSGNREGAAALSPRTAKEQESREFTLSAEEKKELLQLARDAISLYVNKSRALQYETKNPVLREAKGAFVTLRKRGELRGCIGFIEPVLPLYKAVIETATLAASEDPRFPPVSAAELREIEVEVSVLTPLKKISDPSVVQVGKHGLVISRGRNRGLLLPQVPVENNWDRQAFLEQACFKAGLPIDAWKSGAEIFVFEAIVFK